MNNIQLLKLHYDFWLMITGKESYEEVLCQKTIWIKDRQFIELSSNFPMIFESNGIDLKVLQGLIENDAAKIQEAYDEMELFIQNLNDAEPEIEFFLDGTFVRGSS